MPLYPKTAEFIRRGFEDLARIRPARALVGDIAREAEVSAASLVAWRSGTRAPSEAKVEALAPHLFPEDRERQAQFAQVVRNERSTSHAIASPLIDPLDLLEQNEVVEIKVIEAPPFAAFADGPGAGFFNKLIDRYVSFASLGKLRPTKVPFREVNQALLSGSPPAAVAGLLGTVDRMKNLQFINTPIRLGIAGVIRRPRPGEPTKEAVRAALQRAASAPLIRAVIAEGEVGGTFAKKTLGLGPPHVTYVPRGDLAGYREEILAPNTSETAVALLDEYSAGRVIVEQPRSSDRRARGELELLFDPIFDLEVPPPFPQYFLSFGADRRHPRWCRYLAESMELYLEVDTAYVVELCEELWNNLRGHLRDVLRNTDSPHADHEQRAEKWACRMLSLQSVEQSPERDYRLSSRAWNEIIRQLHGKLRRRSSGRRVRHK